jgi:protein TonB
MDQAIKNSNYELRDELARYCLPAAKRDANRKLAWTNSICIFFLLIGVVGAKRVQVIIKRPPPIEQAIPTIIEATPPPPPPAEARPQEEQKEQDKPEAPQVAVVTPNSPAINFSIPTVGSVVAATPMAAIPLAAPPAPVAAVRNLPTTLTSTGKGGDRPEPAYPKILQEQGEQGIVVLSLAVDETGRISDINVKESTGYPLLDRAALDFVKRHWIFPPGAGTRLYEAPIKYVLTP